MSRRPSVLGAWIAAFLSLAGLVGFALLFIPHMDMYGFILAPVILAVYQIPAALVYAVWKRKRRAAGMGREEDFAPSADDGMDSPSDPK